MVKKIAAFIKAQELMPKGTNVIVACSGGPDSLALLSVLLHLAAPLDIELSAAHFDHGIRSQASKDDAAFVAAFCKAHGVPCFQEAGDVPAYAKTCGISIELAARELRYRFLKRVAGKLSLIATAHHLDDQAETVLMRIIRGTGTDGLCAMQAKAGQLIRPFLCVTRKEIERYCKEAGLTPRKDETNDAHDATRNRVRHVILPHLRKENPSVSAALVELSEIASKETELLKSLLDSVWDKVFMAEENALSLEEFRMLYLALQRRALRRFWKEQTRCDDLGFSHVEELRYFFLAGQNGTIDLPHGFAARLSYGKLVLLKKCREGETTIDMGVSAVDNDVTLWGKYQLQRKICHTPFRADDFTAWDFCIDAAAASLPFFLRSRQAGDYIEISHKPRRIKKVKDVFIDAKIPAEERADYPLLTLGSEVLWVPNVRRSTHFSVKNGSPFLHFHMDKLK